MVGSSRRSTLCIRTRVFSDCRTIRIHVHGQPRQQPGRNDVRRLAHRGRLPRFKQTPNRPGANLLAMPTHSSTATTSAVSKSTEESLQVFPLSMSCAGGSGSRREVPVYVDTRIPATALWIRIAVAYTSFPGICLAAGAFGAEAHASAASTPPDWATTAGP